MVFYDSNIYSGTGWAATIAVDYDDPVVVLWLDDNLPSPLGQARLVSRCHRLFMMPGVLYCQSFFEDILVRAPTDSGEINRSLTKSQLLATSNSSTRESTSSVAGQG